MALLHYSKIVGFSKRDCLLISYWRKNAVSSDIALAKGSRWEREVERWKAWTLGTIMWNDDCILNLLCALNVLGVLLFAWSYMPVLWRDRNNLESLLIHSISIWAFLMQNDVVADDAEAWHNHNKSTSQCRVIKCSLHLPPEWLAVSSAFIVHVI